MTSPDLPPALKAAIAQAAASLSRNDAARRAEGISQTYRSGGNSSGIRTANDAATYAVARMPATYAAVTASLNALCEVMPDFTPKSLLDVGAGPGTATWAALETFASLDTFMLTDANLALRELALTLAAASARLRDLRYERGDALKLVSDAPEADLVIASYVINELSERERVNLIEAMWQKTRQVLLIIEPGTPAGYARIIDLRARLIADGAHVAAPCPHDRDCPLTPPDWCHFTQRLQRSRAHMQAKSAELPYEDEKFSYVALSRTAIAQRPARVLAQPQVTKIAVTAKLCAADGLRIESIPHRDKDAYKHAKKWSWGDALFIPPGH